MPREVTSTPAAAAGELDAALAAVLRRMWIADAARAAAWGAVYGAAVTALTVTYARTIALPVAPAGALLVCGVVLWRGRRGRSSRAAAARIERRHPGAHNLIVTAEELRAHPERASAWMRERVMVDAALHVRAVRPSGVVRIGGPLALCAAAVAVWSAVAIGLSGRAAPAVGDGATLPSESRAPAGGAPPRIIAELRAPEYTNVASRELVNPERIDAVAGTVLRLRLFTGEEAWQVRFNAAAVPLRREGRELLADTTLTESGYFAIEPAGADSTAAAHDPRRTLLPVTIASDRPPAIRIDAPARDLLLPPSASRLPVSASAEDDFALQSLELRYTKVSGSGEQFEFEEGRMPFRVMRTSARAWKGRAELALEPLNLAPGDALIYRAVGRDRRPGAAGFASSDTFFIEIQGPGHVALGGIEMPPGEERYALSQQMVVLKIERLRERERSMPRAELEEAAASIAAEQRSVRANFIFLMGGHVEDEFEEAEQSHEIQEGRLENSARREISSAIHQMTLAEQGLTAVSLGRALPPARAAVEALQRAFGRNRYILRTLASRSRIDPSRRLSGELEAASDWMRDLATATLDGVTRESRALLARALGIASALHAGRDVAPAQLAGLAEQALQIEPGSAEWQSAAAQLLRVRDALADKRPSADVAARLDEAMRPILEAAQRDARHARGAGAAPAGALRRAWVEEARK